MRTKSGFIALIACSAVAVGGPLAETAAARTAAPAKHAKKARKSAKKSKRCRIVFVNGIHRCKGEHARKTVSSNSISAPAAPAPVVNNVTINNIDNPPAPAPAPAAAPAVMTPPADTPGNGPKDQNGDGKPGNGPKPKKDKHDHPSHPSHP